MKRIKTIVFVFVPVYMEIAELGCRNRRWLFPRKIGTCKIDEKQPATGRSGFDSLTTLDRNPRLCYENYFQSISHGLRGGLTQKQGEK